MATESSALTVSSREPSGSRAARRLRREGNVPGIVYGGGSEPVTFQVDARALRLALQHAGAVLDLSIDGQGATPVVVKELIRHPVGGEAVHIDLLRVRLDQAIQATVALELVGGDDAPGVKEGGVLEHVTREVTVEALPNDIPDRIEVDVSEMVIGEDFVVGRGVEFAETTQPHAILVSHPQHLITAVAAGSEVCPGVATLGIGYLTVGIDFYVQPEPVS